MKKYQREITSLSPQDCFLVMNRIRDSFNYPVHFHPEYELNFIENGKRMLRTVGESTEEIDDYELVLVGPNVYHGWEKNECKHSVQEITIQFHNDLFSETFMRKTIMRPLSHMFERSIHGILFDKEESKKMAPRLLEVSKLEGLEFFLELFSILYDLSRAPGQRLLSASRIPKDNFENSDRIKLLYDFVQENYSRKITLTEISSLLNMSNVSFNRFIKKSTNKTFVDYLNDVRIEHSARLLAEEDYSVSEIAYRCGFNNIANFNRIFKKSKGRTPSQYRKDFSVNTRVQ